MPGTSTVTDSAASAGKPALVVGAAQPAYSTRQTGAFYLELSVFWFALSFLWGGMITIVIQTLVKNLVGNQKDLYLGWTLGLGALVSTLVCVVVGALSDHSRWVMGRRRPYLIAGTLMSVPVLIWLAYVGSIPALIVNFCLLQFWINVATSPYQALVPDLVPKTRQGTASAYLGMGSLLGQLSGLLLCGTMITRPHGLLIIVTALSGVIVLAMVYTVVRIPEQTASHRPERVGGLLSLVKEAFHVNPRDHPDFFWLIASRFVINMGFYTATQFLLYYVSDTLHAPHPTATVTKIFLITTVSGLIGNFPAGLLSDRMSKKRVVYFSTAITGAAAIVFLLTSSITVAMGAAFLFGMGLGAFTAVDWALATNLLPEYDEAKFMGVWHVAFTVPQVIAPIIGGCLAYIFNRGVEQGFGYRVVLLLVVVYLAAGTAMIRPIRERVFPSGSLQGPIE